MTPETEAKIYEIAFGENAINRQFTEVDLLETLTEFAEESNMFVNIQTALQENGWDINKGVSD